MTEDYFSAASEEHVNREKNKARQMRRSQWWKNRRASGHCYYCQDRFPPTELTMDHVVPLSRGGYTVKSNVVPCCKECNNQKRYMLPIEWEAYLTRLGKRGE